MSRREEHRRGSPPRVRSLRDILAQRVALPAHDLFWYLAPRSTSELRQAVAAMPALEGGFRKSFVYGNALYGLLGHAFPELHLTLSGGTALLGCGWHVL